VPITGIVYGAVGFRKSISQKVRMILIAVLVTVGVAVAVASRN